MKIVTLDADTLPLPLPQPYFCSDWVYRGATSPDEVVSMLQGAEVAITNKVKLRAETLRQLPSLRYICVAATGYDCVDIDVCRELGIAVSNVPGYSTTGVAETVIGYLFALRRHLLEYHHKAVTEWVNAPHFCIHGSAIQDIHGSTLGIIGKGDIGSAVAVRAQALGMKVLYAEHKHATAVRAGYTPFDDVLAHSDILTLHCPLTESTRHLIDEASLQKMKPGALLINTARGPLLDEHAVTQALRQQALGGVAVDVLSEEPPRAGSPLLDSTLPNLIVTPHIGWASAHSVKNLIAGLSANLDGWQRREILNRVA